MQMELVDPVTGQSVTVPKRDAQPLQEQGYKLNPQGFAGSALAGLTSFARGATAGLSDLALNQVNAEVKDQAEAANPTVSTIGELAGFAATAPLQLAIGLPARLAAGSVSGAIKAGETARKLNEPITAERILQGAGIGLLTGLAGEGLGKVVSKAIPAFQWTGNKLLDRAARYLPKVTEEGAEVFAKPFSSEAVASTAAAAALIPGAGPLLGPVAGAMTAANRLPTLLNNREMINRYLTKIAEGPGKMLGDVVRSLVTGAGQAAQTAFVPGQSDDVDEQYAALSGRVEYFANDPQALNATLQARAGRLMQAEPELFGQVVARTQAATQALAAAMPKSPYMPTAQQRPFNPPRYQKLKWLETYQAINNPFQALEAPSRTKIAVLEQVHPETLKLARNMLQGMLNTPAAQKMNASQAQKISVILGLPVRPETSPAFLARVALSHEQAAQQEHSKPLPVPKPSAAVASRAATQEATVMQQRQMELE